MTSTMPAAALELRLGWPYDVAMAEMEAARADVEAGGPMRLFVGSHSQEVVTLGWRAPESQLLRRDALVARGVLVRRVERAGGATAHGPGQLVVYPVLHLPTCRMDVPDLTRALLGAACDLAAEHGIAAEHTLGDAERSAGSYCAGRKLASVGFRVQRGVVTHGLAMNVDNALDLFDLIEPCGRPTQAVCSLASLGRGPFDRRATSLQLALHVARRTVLAFLPESLHRAGGVA